MKITLTPNQQEAANGTKPTVFDDMLYYAVCGLEIRDRVEVVPINKWSCNEQTILSLIGSTEAALADMRAHLTAHRTVELASKKNIEPQQEASDAGTDGPKPRDD